MSTKNISATPKKSYAATLNATTALGVQSTNVCTRSMAKKAVIRATATSLGNAHVPTRPRKISAASIAAAATAIIEAASPSHKEDAKAEVASSPKRRVFPTKKMEEEIIASVMTVGGSSIDDQLLEMKKLLDKLVKDNEEKNKKIDELEKEMMELRQERSSEASEHVETDEDDEGDEKEIEDKPPNNDVPAAFSEKKLEELIASAIKSQLSVTSSNNSHYVKPYSKRIDNLQMPLGYQPPKFQQFDGNGNPRQHIAHFIETCNNAGTYGDHLVKQFVRSLKGNAFDWYTDLDSESIDSWNQMEDEFLNRFYSTRRVVSMSELTNTIQWEEEPVIDYISRWRALSLECKDRLSEASAVDMCINGMQWKLSYILNGIQPDSFQELATRAHDMEIKIKRRHRGHASTSKNEYKKVEIGSKASPEETMLVSTSTRPSKISRKMTHEKKRELFTNEYQRDRPTLKELHAKKYPFPDSDVPAMLDDLLENNLIHLPEPKRPEQANKTTDPNFCCYHRMISHPIEKCITLKEKIMQLAKDGKIILDMDEVVSTNHASVTAEEPIASRTSPKHWLNTCNLHGKDEGRVRLLQFGTTEPVAIWIQTPPSPSTTTSHKVDPMLKSVDDPDDNEGWTVVSHRKPRRHARPPPEPVHHERREGRKSKSRHFNGNKNAKKALKSHVLPKDPLNQKPLVAPTLKEFFRQDYFDKITANTIATTVDDEKEMGAREDTSSAALPNSNPEDKDNDATLLSKSS